MLNSHAHIDFSSVKPYKNSDVCIVPSIGKQNWQKVTNYKLYAYGIHPWYIDKHTSEDLALLEDNIRKNSPIAIGECGLDFKIYSNKTEQKLFFEEQLKLARKFKLPVIIHSVKATEEVILTLKKYPTLRGEIHGFSGSESQAKSLINMGFLLGFGLQITNINSTKLRSLINNIPIESILIETDDHYNPNDIQLVVDTIAQLKQLTLEKTIQICDNNAISLFNL
jgi:TatD DNase family protein